MDQAINVNTTEVKKLRDSLKTSGHATKFDLVELCKFNSNDFELGYLLRYIINQVNESTQKHRD